MNLTFLIYRKINARIVKLEDFVQGDVAFPEE